MTTPLVASGLSRSFGDETAVDAVDLEVRSGEIHALVGLNGAGKTTLMRLLLGMLKPDSGQASVLGNDAHTAPATLWRSVGHLIETPFAYPELTVLENVTASALLRGVESPHTAAKDILNRFELGHWSGRRASTLSLGNRQRLGLASSLVHQPSILVLDEPANALDPAGVVFVRDLLKEHVADGGSVFVSSHHLDQLARVAHRITVMHRGRVVGSLDPSGVDLEQSFFDLVYSMEMER